MNLCLWSDDFKPLPGGVAEYVHQVARHLSLQGDTVVVLTVERPDAEDFDSRCGYPVVRISGGDPTRRLPWQRLGRHLARRHTFNHILRKYNIQHVLHADFGGLSPALIRWGLRRNVPFSAAVHGMYILDDYGTGTHVPESGKHLSRASAVFANSAYTAQVIRSLGVSAVHIVYPATDPEFFTPGRVSTEDRSRVNAGPGPVILSACRLVRRKGIDMALEAVARLLPDFPTLRYLVAGDGPELESLKNRAAELGIAPVVQFLGYRSGEDLRTLYRMCDCFVMPCRELPGHDVETFGMVFLEANACGRPVVGGRSGGVVDAIADGATGFLVDPNNVSDIAAAVSRLLSDRFLADQMGLAGRNRVEKEFTWSVSVARMRGILAQSLGGGA